MIDKDTTTTSRTKTKVVAFASRTSLKQNHENLPLLALFFFEKWNKTVNDTHSQNSQAPNSALSKQIGQVRCKAVLTTTVGRPTSWQKICRKTRTTCASTVSSKRRTRLVVFALLVSTCARTTPSVVAAQCTSDRNVHNQLRSLEQRKSAGKNSDGPFIGCWLASDQCTRLTANAVESVNENNSHSWCRISWTESVCHGLEQQGGRRQRAGNL